MGREGSGEGQQDERERGLDERTAADFVDGCIGVREGTWTKRMGTDGGIGVMAQSSPLAGPPPICRAPRYPSPRSLSL
jgi:hypothetical protein